jgi:hypothetical protein
MTATTNAVVVSMTTERSTSQNSGTACSLIVRYTVAGKEYTQPSSISSGGNCALSAGQTIPINYNPQNPGSWVYNLKSITMFLSIFFWAGLLFAVTSFITFIIRLLSIIYGWKLLQQGRTLAKSLPQGVSLGGLIEEIKQNFTGVVFNHGAAGVPMIPGLSFMQATPQAQAVPNPIQQDVVSPAAPMSPPQQVTNLDNPFMQPTQTPAQTVSAPPLTSPPEPATVNPTSDPAVHSEVNRQNDYPSSQPPLS